MRYRFSFALLLVALACLTVALMVSSLPSFAFAQTAQQTAVPTLAPTLTPTRTPGELVGLGEPINWISEVWTRFGWGILILGAIVVVGWLISKYIEGIGEGVKDEGKAGYGKARSFPGRLAGDSHIRRYLTWLRGEYGYLPQIGVATEQVQLDVESVYIPLYAVERDEIEAHQRRMRGEDDIGNDRPKRTSAAQRSLFSDLDEQRNNPILALLSEKAEIARHWRTEQQRQRLFAPLDAIRKRLLPNRKQHKYNAPDNIEQALAKLPPLTRCLIVLGGAGSGKTMTLRYAALRCADAYERHSARALHDGLSLYLREPPLPIYVRLTLFAKTLPSDLEKLPSDERSRYLGAPIDTFLAWLDRDAGLPSGVLAGRVRRGGCLLLLDGLDEAGSETRRAYLTELITSLANDCSGNRYVVASRTAGYGGRVRLGSFTERHLSPLDDDGISDLAGKWFGAVYARLDATGRVRQGVGAEDHVDNLMAALRANPRLFEMATNPLLATTTALLQYNNIRLPNQRAKLYEKLVDLLLDLWRKTTVGNDTLATSVAQLSTEQRRIQQLALEMQCQPKQAREVSLAQAQGWLSPIYMERTRIDRERADTRVAALLESLSIESGLLQRSQREERVYSFSHYTFQEYLAACGLDALDQQGGQQSIDFLLQRWNDQRWRETLLLAAGQWSNGQQIAKTERLLVALLDLAQFDADMLVAEALVDIGDTEELTALRGRCAAHLRPIAFDPACCPDPRQRQRAAVLLDRLDADKRPELDPAQPGYWATRIEPGRFVMGPSGQRENDAFTTAIHKPYALACFPVTNRLYQQYIDALARSGDDKELKQRLPGGRRGQRFTAGEGNQPVVKVNWSDGTAFAAWLDAELRRRGVLAAGEQIRLPLETEWERTAAYPSASAEPNQRREYPWGALPTPKPTADTLLAQMLNTAGEAETALAGPANTEEVGINGASVVGIFPDGQADCGAQDMAGNVWEWCANAYQPYPLPDNLAPWDGTGNIRLVLRGGSFYQSLTTARCGARGGYLVVDDHDYGFRLVRSFSA